MIFKKLVLTNIGPYLGVNRFSFDTKDDKNTIIIGGKNGSGKTTFLNSVRLALYGPLAYGYKTESNEYLKKVRGLLNSNALEAYSNNHFKIRIDFKTVENFKNINVSIVRSWNVTEKSIKEKVAVIKDDEHLNEVQKDEFFESLRTTFPPSLLELCLFDGEDISRLTSEDTLSKYIKDLSSHLFNLDLFHNLEKDLENYISQSSKTSKEASLENDKEVIEEDLTSKLELLKELNDDLNTKKEELEINKQKFDETKKEFSLHGGLIYEERTKVENRISALETERKHVNDKIKEFIATDLPFYIAIPNLVNLVQQLKDEEEYHISNILKDKISNLPLSEIVNELGIQQNNEKEAKLKNTLMGHLAENKDVDIIHNASKTEAQSVFSLLSETNINKLHEISNLISKNKNDLEELQQLRRKLKDNETSSEFSEMIIAMERYTHEIAKLENEISQLQGQIVPLQDEIESLNKKYEKVKNDLHNLYKTKSSYNESQKVINISKKFQENQLRKKLKDVEYFSSKMINELLRKDLFINQIKIDFKTFQLSLVGYENEEIDKEILSAGEKELLVLSVIWGTITSSKKQLPFILDTLLGRLDKEHKQSIITKLIPKFSDQIMILSTDSEISEELYEKLSPFISNEYTLNYNNLEKKTEIESHFFNHNVKVGVN
ncbi:DNA sulfur modification protein DndD [Salinibacillus aidingensis]|uniref:Nuclease SbcCD subunit C n=1 Tax=Salinibacillus aidingensis TaxID=237684 RepID=A0ABP3L4U7_9BACI